MNPSMPADPPVPGGEADGRCVECAGVSRRGLLRSMLGSAFVAAGLGSDVRYAFAAPAGASPGASPGPGAAPSPGAGTGTLAGDTLVLLSLRGGFDGLSAVVPVSDPVYRTVRPTVGIPVSTVLPLDTAFGLHPALAPLLPLWQAGTMAVVQDVGQADPTRSHFEAMRELEKAAPGSSVRTGWLDRLLAALPGGTTFAGAQVGTAKPTDAFKGPVPELALHRIDDFTLWGTDSHSLPAVQRLYRSLYARAPEVVRTPALAAMDAITTTSALTAAGYTPSHGATYPATDVGQALRDVARLIRARVGMRVAVVDVDSWDMHAAMGTVDSGQLRSRLGELAAAVAAFTTDLADLLGTITMVTLSEFGRRVAENGSGGADHGHGNCVLVIGGGVVGGRMYGRWPGLVAAGLVQGDLPGSTDYRQILAEIAARRMGASETAALFPGLTPAPLGVLRQRSS